MGSAAGQILHFAKINKIDMIVMGSRQIERYHENKGSGSVARKVSEIADCPVLVVHRN
jgi:nucleotide-binding universal stress UspA family protein